VAHFSSIGASISALNNAKLTPFHSAVLRGNAPVVKFYLEHALKYPAEQGCHPSKAAADGRTVLQLAIASKSVEVVGAVVKYATVHDVDARWRELPIIISNEKLVADIRQALLTKVCT
jgi:ankyrin repeat protein